MSLLGALRALDTASDPLIDVLRTLPFNVAEESAGHEWVRLQALLRLDTSPGRLLVTSINAARKEAPKTYVDPSWEQITRLSDSGLGVFFGLSKVPDTWVQQAGNRGTAATCLPRAFLGVDFDLSFGAHKAGSISLEQAVDAVERFPARPCAVAFSGGGFHAYYRLPEAADAAAITWFGDRVNGWYARATDAAQWDSKPTVDLARVLRVPGTVNQKSGNRWVRLVHEDDNAAPITRAMASDWPTFMEVKGRAMRAPGLGVVVPRVKRDVPKMRRVHADDATPPWDEFDLVFDNEGLFATFLERLGADVNLNASTARMPGAPGLGENTQYSANIHSNAESTTMLLTIHGTATCAWWALGRDRKSFSASALLARVFDGDWSALSKYIRRVVLPDVEAWLEEFEWTPGDPAPVVPQEAPTKSSPPRAAVSAVPDYLDVPEPDFADVPDFDLYALDAPPPEPEWRGEVTSPAAPVERPTLALVEEPAPVVAPMPTSPRPAPRVCEEPGCDAPTGPQTVVCFEHLGDDEF